LIDGMRHLDDDGIMRTFIDRYSAIVNHDSILKEEEPSPIPAIMEHLMAATHHYPAVGHHGAYEHHGVRVLPEHLAGAFEVDLTAGHAPIID